MKLKSDVVVPVALTFAMAGVSAFVGSGGCIAGSCMVIPMPAALNATQQGPGRGQATPLRDAELEAQYTKSLEAAWYYFKRRLDKSNKDATLKRLEQIEGRLQEILDIYPAFSKIDEVYFLMGEVNQRRGDNDKAVEYYNKILNEFSDSRFTKDARKRLDELNAGKDNRKS